MKEIVKDRLVAGAAAMMMLMILIVFVMNTCSSKNYPVSIHDTKTVSTAERTPIK